MFNFFRVLQGNEPIYVCLLIFLILSTLIKSLVSNNNIQIFSPIFFISVVYLVYTVIGPLVFLNLDVITFPKGFMRKYYEPAWLGSLLSLIAINIGYCITFKKVRPIKLKPLDISRKLFFAGVIINLIGLSLYCISNPSRFFAQLNPFAVASFGESTNVGGFVNYLVLSINFLITGNGLLMLSIRKIRPFNFKTILFLFFFLLTLSLYLSIGFRFRILILLVSLFVAYYIKKNSRPNFIYMFTFLFIIIMFLGVIGKLRTYSSGLDLSKINDNQESSIVTGLRDTNTFQFSGVVIATVPKRLDYVYFDIIISTLVFPIPKKLYPNKKTDEHIRNPIRIYPTLSSINAHNWAAMLFFAEWYTAFGWFGVIFVSLLLGFWYRRLWEWLKQYRQDEFKVLIYAICLSYLYIIISRGYFPFIVMNSFFIILPSVIALFCRRIKFIINNEASN
ncbi:MAG: O-antigen polymerase [Bacteroidota bacterium]